MFCLADVAKVLAIGHARNFLRTAWCDAKGVISNDVLSEQGGVQKHRFISEPNLYALVLRSKKPQALAFHKWIVSEVLPGIRKTGRYGKPGVEVRFEFTEDGTRTTRVSVDEEVVHSWTDTMPQFQDSPKALPMPSAPALTGRAANIAMEARATFYVNNIVALTRVTPRRVWGEAYAMWEGRTGINLAEQLDWYDSKIQVIREHGSMGVLVVCLHEMMLEAMGVE